VARSRRLGRSNRFSNETAPNGNGYVWGGFWMMQDFSDAGIRLIMPFRIKGIMA